MAELEIVAEGLRFPEGPVAMPDGSVILVEIAAGRITRIRPDGVQGDHRRAGQRPERPRARAGRHGSIASTMAAFPGSKARARCARISPPPIMKAAASTGSTSPPARSRLCTEAAITASPCAAPTISCSMRMAASTSPISARCARATATRPACSMRRPTAASSPRWFIRWTRPTASASRPTARSSTPPRPSAPGSGPFRSRRRARLGPARHLYRPAGFTWFDSLAVEANGNICVATLGESGISVVSPEGALVEFVPTPDFFTTNIAFGGPDMRTAWITLSESGRLAKTRWPRPGLRLAY